MSSNSVPSEELTINSSNDKKLSESEHYQLNSYLESLNPYTNGKFLFQDFLLNDISLQHNINQIVNLSIKTDPQIKNKQTINVEEYFNYFPNHSEVCEVSYQPQFEEIYSQPQFEEVSNVNQYRNAQTLQYNKQINTLESKSHNMFIQESIPKSNKKVQRSQSLPTYEENMISDLNERNSNKKVIYSDDDNEISTNLKRDTQNNSSSSFSSAFCSAKQQYIKDQKKKYGNNYTSENNTNNSKKKGGTLGLKRRFTSPKTMDDENISLAKRIISHSTNTTNNSDIVSNEGEDIPEEYRNIDPAMIERIENEIVYTGSPVTWNDIAGLAYAKRCIMEMVIWPMQRPDIFTGLREVPRGLLLFGPPGTGKTLLGKAIAYVCKYTFFSISSSTLTSKWIGEGEKMVRALFAVASVRGPSVIFIDEIDSLLTLRTDGENEGTRRLKTEFLVQLDGITSKGRILVIGATNRPQDLDEAARRRFVKRLYIPLPDSDARTQLFISLLKQNKCQINLNDSNENSEVCKLVEMSKGYSCADIYNVCREAALGPLREMTKGINGDLLHMNVDDMRGISFDDFIPAFRQIRSSVGQNELKAYIDWNNQYGSSRIEEESSEDNPMTS